MTVFLLPIQYRRKSHIFKKYQENVKKSTNYLQSTIEYVTNVLDKQYM